MSAYSTKPCTSFSVQDNWEAASYMMQMIKKDTSSRLFDRYLEHVHTTSEYYTGNYELNHGGSAGWNVLGSAALKGNAQLVKHIVKIGGENLLDLGNENGWTPLRCAAECEDIEGGYLAAKSLIDLGADPDLADIKGKTPLMTALKKTNIKMIKLFLDNGALIPQHLSEESGILVDEIQGEFIKG